MKILTKLTIAISFLILTSCSVSKIDIPEITEGELVSHIEYLASDDLKGRLPGTEGDLAAASYIRDQLLSFGLTPLCENGLQNLDIVASVKAGKESKLEYNDKSYMLEGDFYPLAISEDAELNAAVVFAGYGFSIATDNINWDDYSELDVKDKWVIILRADPEVDNPMSSFASFSNDRDKAMLAKDKGAGGVLFVSGEKFDQLDEFERMKKGEFSVGIPVIRIKRSLANDLLSANNTVSITQLEEVLNNGRKPHSFTTGVTLNAKSQLVQEIVSTYNVIMELPGNNPSLSNQFTIIGGHYDHLGMGGPGSSSRAVDTVAVHYGADDNASGIAAMLEIAEKAASANTNSRSIIFSAFAAEEMGLLGSKHMANNLPFSADSVNAMINMDMVGRLKENNLIQIGGVGTAPDFEAMVTRLTDSTKFAISRSQEGYGPSDHSSFYGVDIPVLYFSTGAHLDYHTPADSPEKINYPGLVKVSDLIYTYLQEISDDSEKLAFTEAGPKVQASRGMRRKGVSLGIMPDFAGNVENGLRADFVTPGKPAQLGGMQKGDIITAINGMEINNIQDYMFRLSKLKFGETINVEILRDDKKELLLIKL